MTTTETAKKTDDTKTGQYLRVAVDNIHPDPDQPRKTFDPDALQELATTISEHGIIVPLELRPHPTKNHGSYMLVAGERRLRAAKLVGLREVPAIVKTLTDKEALEHQLLENAQRVDVPAIEEGEAYKALLDEHDYTMEMLIQKTGRSRSHLFDRIKLTKLPAGVKKLIGEGKLEHTVAELATRIHDPKLQEQFVKECLGEGKDDAYRKAGIEAASLAEGVDKEGYYDKHTTQPLSHRQASTLLRRRYMLRLVEAKFDTADAGLVAKAGSCTQCPKRSGNQPQLPGLDSAASAEDLCTDPACFEQKTDAAWKDAAARAKAKQQEVYDQKKAKAFYGYRDELSDSAPVAALDQELPYNLRKPGSTATFGKLLGKEIANVPKILVQDPSGAPVELLDKEAAIKKLRELGKLDEAKKSKQKATSSGAGAKYLKEQKAKRELAEAVLQRVLQQVAEKAATLWKPTSASEQKALAIVRWAAIGFIEDYADAGGDTAGAILTRRGLENYDMLIQQLHKAKGGEVIATVAEFVFALHSEGKLGLYNKRAKEFFDEGLKLLGVDWKKAETAAKAAIEAEAKADAAKDKKAEAKPAKKGGRK